jgi:cellulose synthase/poly-beta-1,6-N-acetylglucosamine synthase-like glycosyltransferase
MAAALVGAALISWLGVIVAVLIAIPTAVFCSEIAAALWRRQLATDPIGDRRPRVAVLVPAHNESGNIAPTLENIRKQLRPGERLLVVADNCTDDTAAVARAAGAEVVERQDPKHLGKGYALDHGLRCLANDPPDIVVIIDADCWLATDAIARLAGASAMTGRPAQALYLMEVPAGAGINQQIAGFAWRIKNWVRPLGLQRLGLPCQLTGSGMAFPWPAIRAVDLASGWIVEDLKLGLDAAAAGNPPLFCPAAQVTSQFAISEQASADQRRRWEHGSLMTMLRFAPRLLWVAIANRDFAVLALTLDLAVPPLSLLAVMLIGVFAITGTAALLTRAPAGFIISAAALVGFAIAVACAWVGYGREVLPMRAILSVPTYVLKKFGLYGQLLSGKRQTQWVKTDRTKT